MLFATLFLPLVFANLAYAQESTVAQGPTVMEQITPNGKIKVQLLWPRIVPDELFIVGTKFLDQNTDQPMSNVTITYDVTVLQRNATIENYPDQSTSTGITTFEVEFPAGGYGSAQVIIVIKSIANGSNSVQMNEKVTFDTQVVPEFSGLAVMVMAFSIATVLTLSRFKRCWH